MIYSREVIASNQCLRAFWREKLVVGGRCELRVAIVQSDELSLRAARYEDAQVLTTLLAELLSANSAFSMGTAAELASTGTSASYNISALGGSPGDIVAAILPPQVPASVASSGQRAPPDWKLPLEPAPAQARIWRLGRGDRRPVFAEHGRHRGGLGGDLQGGGGSGEVNTLKLRLSAKPSARAKAPPTAAATVRTMA